MGRSLGRERHFEKYIRNTPDHITFISALGKSPYRTHQRMAKNLVPLVEGMEAKALQEIESEKFAKS